MEKVSFSDVKNNQAIKEYIRQADRSLLALGYTEHSLAHVGNVQSRVEYILRTLDFSPREVELASIAAYMHDIGNLVNRVDHSQSGAIMAFRLLDKMGMEPAEIAEIVTAIGNHDEGTGVPVNPIAAALIIADKTDVRRSRVRNHDVSTFDIHDRVNYSVSEARLEIDKEEKVIQLVLTIETKYSSVMEYFEIFLERMMMCRRAAECLGLRFSLSINGQVLL
jgi:metal-dependent HD superfamily phosphatase/phosphodiesterase